MRGAGEDPRTYTSKKWTQATLCVKQFLRFHFENDKKAKSIFEIRTKLSEWRE